MCVTFFQGVGKGRRFAPIGFNGQISIALGRGEVAREIAFHRYEGLLGGLGPIKFHSSERSPIRDTTQLIALPRVHFRPIGGDGYVVDGDLAATTRTMCPDPPRSRRAIRHGVAFVANMAWKSAWPSAVAQPSCMPNLTSEAA